MDAKKLLACGVMALFACSVCAEDEPDGVSYIKNQVITESPDMYSEARDWGMCSAAFSAIAEIYSDQQPATSKRLSQLANGARVPIFMLFILQSSEGDGALLKERFESALTMGKASMESMTDTASTMLLADLEQLEAAGQADQWFANLAETVKVCIQNGVAQEAYIDSWRELSTSGLVTLPET